MIICRVMSRFTVEAGQPSLIAAAVDDTTTSPAGGRRSRSITVGITFPGGRPTFRFFRVSFNPNSLQNKKASRHRERIPPFFLSGCCPYATSIINLTVVRHCHLGVY